MKNFFLIPILVCFLFTAHSNAQWGKTNGPSGGIITPIDIMGSSVFGVTSKYELVRKENFGEDWNIIYFNEQPEYYLKDFTIDQENIYIFFQNGQAIKKSTNNGQNWLNVGNPNITASEFSELGVHNSNLYLFYNSDGVYRSSDNGSSWTNISSDLNGSYVEEFISFSDTLIVRTRDGFYISTNEGVNWMNEFFFPHDRPSAVEYNNGTFYVSVGNRGLYKKNSTNWELLDHLFKDLEVKDIVASNNNVLVGTLQGLYISDDGGDSWYKPKNELKNLKVYNTIIKNGIYYLGTEAGFYYSRDGGTTWIRENNGLNDTKVPILLGVGNKLFGEVEGLGLFSSTDNGDTWESHFENVPFYDIKSLKNNNGVLFLGTNSGVLRSTDVGVSWDTLNSNLINTKIHNIKLFDGNVYVNSDSGLSVSDDNGDTWSKPFNNQNLYDFVVRNDTVFKTVFGGVAMSTDDGLSWQQFPGIPENDIMITQKLYNYKNKVFVLMLEARFYSLTMGDSIWRPTLVGYSVLSELNYYYYKDLLFAAYGDDLYYSSDVGDNWTRVLGYNILDLGYLISLTSDEEYLYVGTTDNGIWRSPLSDFITDVESVTSEIPNEYLLEQNYPNPFNPSTNITYSLPVAEHVVIKIYDNIGKEVKTLVSEYKSAGSYKIEWNAVGLSSGVYFYRIEIGNKYSETKKALLIR